LQTVVPNSKFSDIAMFLLSFVCFHSVASCAVWVPIWHVHTDLLLNWISVAVHTKLQRKSTYIWKSMNT